MTKMGDILKEKYQDLIAYRCSAHLLILVEKEVFGGKGRRQFVSHYGN